MARLLLLIVIVVAVVWLLKRALRKAQGGDAQQGGGEPKASQDLVRCARCGVLLPRGEARMSAGALYCSEEHAGPA